MVLRKKKCLFSTIGRDGDGGDKGESLRGKELFKNSMCSLLKMPELGLENSRVPPKVFHFEHE